MVVTLEKVEGEIQRLSGSMKELRTQEHEARTAYDALRVKRELGECTPAELSTALTRWQEAQQAIAERTGTIEAKRQAAGILAEREAAEQAIRDDAEARSCQALAVQLAAELATALETAAEKWQQLEGVNAAIAPLIHIRRDAALNPVHDVNYDRCQQLGLPIDNLYDVAIKLPSITWYRGSEFLQLLQQSARHVREEATKISTTEEQSA